MHLLISTFLNMRNKIVLWKKTKNTYIWYSKHPSIQICSRMCSPKDIFSWGCSNYSESIVRQMVYHRLSKRKFISRLLEFLPRYNSSYFQKEITELFVYIDILFHVYTKLHRIKHRGFFSSKTD